MAEPDPFRALRNALLLPSGGGAPPRRIAVAAPSPQVDSTATAAGLARTLAESGARVIAVDCDFARPSLHTTFGLGNESGLAAALWGGAAPALDTLPAAAGELSVLSAGQAAEGGSAMLGSARFQEVLDVLLEKADHLVLNTPPVSPTTDGVLVAARADAVLLVLQSGRTTRRAGQDAIALLRRAGAPLLGAVVI